MIWSGWLLRPAARGCEFSSFPKKSIQRSVLFLFFALSFGGVWCILSYSVTFFFLVFLIDLLMKIYISAVCLAPIHLFHCSIYLFIHSFLQLFIRYFMEMLINSSIRCSICCIICLFIYFLVGGRTGGIPLRQPGRLLRVEAGGGRGRVREDQKRSLGTCVRAICHTPNVFFAFGREAHTRAHTPLHPHFEVSRGALSCRTHTCLK